jgi:uncharacterized membrane protein YfcA
MNRSTLTTVFFLVAAAVLLSLQATPALAAAAVEPAAWWYWPLLLFVASFALGVVAVPSGVGGGVLFVPMVGAFFPFHLDFVRATGLAVAMAGALAAGPRLLRAGYADLRLALPPALIASVTAVAGALAGFSLSPKLVEIFLGFTILAIAALMALSKRAEVPQVEHSDRWAIALGLGGSFVDAVTGRRIDWRVHRTAPGLALFAVIGFLAGMFGLGAGWANVPVLNLLMGLPLKVALGTSGFIIAVSSSAAWVYLHEGAMIPLIVAPAVIGVMLGALLGARLLSVLPASTLRMLVICMLFVAGGRMLMKGILD